MKNASKPCILAIDQGTSATKALLVSDSGQVVAQASAPVRLQYPQPGWAEQDGDEIWQSVRQAASECLSEREEVSVAAIGLSTQRESVLLWDRKSGDALGPVVSWMDRRGADDAVRLRQRRVEQRVQQATGLPLDPMFSALKARWLLERYDPDRSRSRRGDICLGTVDSWLLHRIGGDHVIEVGNAARTQLMDLDSRRWSPEMLDVFDVPSEVLPRIVSSAGEAARTDVRSGFPSGVPVSGVLGDSHAALFAHAGWRHGRVKVTYGTGSSVMGLTRAGAADPSSGLARTIAWQIDEPAYAVEGNISATGATLVWLAEILGTTPAGAAKLAEEANSDGVVLVPAFKGLAAPWWDRGAVGLISGLTLGTTPAQLARAALESTTFQVEDVVSAADECLGRVDTILADGGATSNVTLMQLQADTSGRRVESTHQPDQSALGAAHVAGLGTGMWSWQELEEIPRPCRAFVPMESETSRGRRTAAWREALDRARGARR